MSLEHNIKKLREDISSIEILLKNLSYRLEMIVLEEDLNEDG